MRILDLANPSESDIKFTISSFPDGQQTIDITSPMRSIQYTDVWICSHMNSFRDLELIIAANQILRNDAEASSVSLYVPYFLGARSDRKFREGGVHYLKQVICPVINSQKFDAVRVLDPHSDVLEACLDNFKKINNFGLVEFALRDIGATNDRIILVSPDGGALKKIYDVAEHFKITNIVTAMKHRDIETGKITHTSVPLDDSRYYDGMKFVIVDDICDGGRTFIELAKAIRVKVPDAEIHLVVTHGIFSAGYDALSEQFKQVYTTNSVIPVTPHHTKLVKVHKVL